MTHRAQIDPPIYEMLDFQIENKFIKLFGHVMEMIEYSHFAIRAQGKDDAGKIYGASINYCQYRMYDPKVPGNRVILFNKIEMGDDGYCHIIIKPFCMVDNYPIPVMYTAFNYCNFAN